jgi:hypothetical protein
MNKTRFVLNVGLVSAFVAAACSGDDGTGASVIPDGAAAGGAGTGGRSAGGGGPTGGAPMGGGGMVGIGGKRDGGGGSTSTGGAKATGGVTATGGRDGGPGGSDASVTDGSAGSDGAPEAAAPGCPEGGKYSFTFTGSGCGDVDSSAPSQRYDGFNCRGRFEYDGNNPKGVSGGSVTFAADGGALAASPLSIGSATMSCTGRATATTVSLACSGEAGTCSIQMTRTGPL